MIKKFSLSMGIVASLFSACSHVGANEDTFDADLQKFLLSNATQTMMHEAGHLVIDQFDLPILGQEEDAADNFATMVLLGFDNDDGADALWDSAISGYMRHDYDGPPKDNAEYFDNHDLDIQRASRIICHFIGVDPETYGDLIKEFNLEKWNIEECEYTYEMRSRDWERVLEPHIATASSTSKIVIEYAEPEAGYESYANLLRDNSLLENLAKHLSETYDFEKAITLRASNCGEPNAFYSAEDVQLDLCYELLADIEYYYREDQE